MVSTLDPAPPNNITMLKVSQMSPCPGITSTFHVYFVPQQFTVCLHLLEELMISRTVFDQIQFGEYKLGLIPFDTDILSLEMDGCFKQVIVLWNISLFVLAKLF